MVVPTTEEQQTRPVLVNELVEVVVNHLKSTLYHFIETDSEKEPDDILGLIFYEVDILYLKDIAVKYELNKEEFSRFYASVHELVKAQYYVMTSQRYAGISGAIFKIHTVVFTESQIGPTSHPCERMSVTAGCGMVPWSEYNPAEQLDMMEFVYNLIDRVGDGHDASDIIINPNRYVVQFDIRELVNI